MSTRGRCRYSVTHCSINRSPTISTKSPPRFLRGAVSKISTEIAHLGTALGCFQEIQIGRLAFLAKHLGVVNAPLVAYLMAGSEIGQCRSSQGPDDTDSCPQHRCYSLVHEPNSAGASDPTTLIGVPRHGIAQELHSVAAPAAGPVLRGEMRLDGAWYSGDACRRARVRGGRDEAPVRCGPWNRRRAPGAPARTPDGHRHLGSHRPGFHSISRMAACTAATIMVMARTSPSQFFELPRIVATMTEP